MRRSRIMDRKSFAQTAGFKYPTGLGEIDRLLGGGLSPGSLVGLVGRTEIGSVLSSLALQVSASFAQVVPTAFITMAMDEEELDSQLEKLGAHDSAYGPRNGLATYALRDIDIDEIADVAWSSYEAVVIDGLHSALLENVDEGPSFYTLSPEEDEFDALKTLTRTSGTLIVATAPLRYYESFDAMRDYHREGSVAYDVLMLVDVAMGWQDADRQGMPKLGTAQIRLFDAASDLACPKVILSHNSEMHSFGNITDDTHPQWIEASDDCNGLLGGVGRLHKDEADWFERFMRSHLKGGGGHPFSRYMWDSSPHVYALLGCLLRHDEEVKLNLPFCSPDISSIITLLKHDYPELFYVNGIASIVPAENECVVVRMRYRLGRDDVVRRLCAMEDAIGALIDDVRVIPVDRRIARVHEWLCTNVTRLDVQVDGLSSADAALLESKATDVGITQAWHFICDRADIGAGATFGTKGGKCRAWSTVCFQPGKPDYVDIGSQVYLHVDIAEDVGLSNASGETSSAFYAITDRELDELGYERPYALVNEYARACAEPYPAEML